MSVLLAIFFLKLFLFPAVATFCQSCMLAVTNNFFMVVCGVFCLEITILHTQPQQT